MTGVVSDLFVDHNSKKVFLARSNSESYDQYLTIETVEYDNHENENIDAYKVKNKEIVYQMPLGVWEVAKIASYNSQLNILMFVISSGDGCGGREKVYTVDTLTKQSRLVLDAATGCLNGDRFGGFYQGKIVGATTNDEVDTDYIRERGLENLYLLDSATLQKTILPFDVAELQEKYPDAVITLVDNFGFWKSAETDLTDAIILRVVSKNLDSQNRPEFDYHFQYLPETNELIPYEMLLRE